ncbi:MAG: hypothetical protein HY770_00150 [Chitinivibrionia bacterium]|nr:hypothetical protein [Chitinivibrionia bacterium]
MPIKYDVFRGGHFIHAIATGVLAPDECIEFEVAHATDERIASPLSELLEIRDGACVQLTKDNISTVLEKRKRMKRLPTPHKCAIYVSYADSHSWDLAVHYPESVIVFGDVKTARIWLGVKDVSPEENAFIDSVQPSFPRVEKPGAAS